MKPNKIVIASHNDKKIAEIKNMLTPFNIEVLSATELDLPDVEETGKTFAENAILKAKTLANLCGLPCLGDDSGLCVDALDGRPGVYSARYAPNRDFNQGMDMLIHELENSGTNNWSAHFSCVLAFALPNSECTLFEGRVDGKIVAQKSGTNGLGYDPIFCPDGYNKTFACFSQEEKAAISHRGRAFKKFISWLQS